MTPTGGLRRNVISAVVTAIGALILALLLLEDPLVEYRLGELAHQTLSDAVADEVGALTGTRLTLLEGDEVVGDTGLDDSQRSAAPVHAESLAAFRAGQPVPRSEFGEHVIFAQEGALVIQATQSTAVTERVRSSVRELLLLAGVMAAVVALFLTTVLTRTFVAPARELTAVADSLAAGDLSARARSTRDDELGAIGRALDRMADQLAERIDRLRTEQDRLRTVLNSMIEAVFVTDSLGRIEQTNDAFDRLIEGAAIGRTPMEALRSPELHEAVRAARRGEARAVAFEIQLDEELRSFSGHVAPLQEGAGVVTVLHDVTELRAADRIRRDFVANASHELRTPLTAIRGFAETLKDGVVDDPEAARRFLDVILKHTLRLQALVADLAALAKAESPEHRLELEEVDVEAVVVEVVRGLASKAEGRGVQLVFEPPAEPLRVQAHERALDQVLINLVDNAIKYTPEGTSVHVRVRAKDEDVLLEVNNPGAAIPPHHLERIFERFYRIDVGRSRDVGGTGLGLAIVKHLCAQMGAEVKARSRDDEGTTFTVRLARVVAPDAPLPKAP
ncbi:MAG TPA: ATP-binding protein [Polyangiaceae bacterium LLY-WYZ-15_(1-7)]|nr:ATP-binding protein [Polyangiaceae bacterium LLY-WYZ-15_(1-7)]